MKRITFFLGFILVLQISFAMAQTRQDTLGVNQTALDATESQHHLDGKQSGVINDSFIMELDSTITRYNQYNPLEKVYLHTDRDLFSSGETLWYAGYTVLGEYHHFSLASKVIHVNLIGPNTEILVSQTHELFNGKTNGSIVLPKNLPSGKYQLRAYTNWMRNFDDNFFFTKMVEVVGETELPVSAKNILDEIDLQFFPEGGHAVAGLVGQVAFKAIGSDGLDRKVLGYINDSQGKSVVNFSTITRGSGFFSLQPKFGETYTAKLADGSEYKFPKIMDEGYTMTINNTGQKNIIIKIQASESLRKNPFYMIGQVNNIKYFQGKFEFENKETLSLEIPKNGFPSGLLAFTLFDESKKPWCERVVFINNQKELVINAKINPEKISKRNEIAVDVTVTDSYGEPVSTEFSVAITDEAHIAKNLNSGNILTHLLLQSDIKGHIQNPGLLFKDQNRLTLYALDLVMLTHGWRKFPWQEIQEKQLSTKKFDFAKGLTISGEARSGIDKRLKNNDLNIITKSGDVVGMLSTKTDGDGKFSIPYFNSMGTTRMIFNALSSGKTPLNVKVALDDNSISVPPSDFKSLLIIDGSEETISNADHASIRKNLRHIYESQKVTELEEVVVTEKVADKIETTMPSTLGQTPHATLFTKDTRETSLNLVDYVGRFPSVTVSGSMPNYQVSIRRGGNPLWVINGIPVATDLSQTRPSVPGQIASMDISNVERVEVLAGPTAVMWGSRGANGVFLVYTKRGGGSAAILAPEFDIEGHAAEREFYSPNYSIKLDRHNAPDYRTTLYWNPSFRTDSDGNARILFYNSDNAERLQVAIEGLSNSGDTGVYLSTFETKK